LKRKYFICIAILLLAVSLCIMLPGCGQARLKDIKSIRIVSGSFKESYALDETFDFSGAYIVATYADDTTERIGIEADWVTGLDLTTTGSKTLEVSYRDKKTSFIYNVTYKMTITTPVRLISGRADEGDNKVLLLTLNETERMPVYAVKLIITLSGLTFNKIENNVPEGWAVAEHQNGSVLTMLFYSKTGTVALDRSQALTKLSLQGSAGGIVYVQTLITDGATDRKAPDLTITI